MLVSNNLYGRGDIAGLGRRARLDRGTLGLFAVTVTSAVQAAGLLRGTSSRGLTRLAAPQVGVDADTAQIPVGVDGEALVLDTPGAAPCNQPPSGSGSPRPSWVPDPKPIMDGKRLWHTALTVARPEGMAVEHR